MGFQGVKLGIAALGNNVSWYDLYVRTWPCSASGDVNRCISSKRTYTLEAWKGDVDPRAWKCAVTTFPTQKIGMLGCRLQDARDAREQASDRREHASATYSFRKGGFAVE
jgi:hypothetical protein